MKMNKYVRMFLILILYTALFYIVSHASISGYIYPFAFALMFALVWANQKVYIVCPAYFFAQMAFSFSFENIISALVAVFMCGLPYYIHVLCKKNIRKWELGIFAVLGQTAKIVFDALGGVAPYFIPISIVVGVMFMYALIYFFEPLIIRGFAYKLTNLELICGASFLMVVSNGLSAFDLFGFSFLKLFIVFILLVISYTTKWHSAIMLAGILGLGTLLGSNNPLYIAPFVIWALIITCFRTQKRVFPAIAVLLSELIVGFYFKLYYSYGYLDVLPVILGVLIFIAVPKAFYQQIGVLLSTNNDRLAMKNVVNRNREIMHRRLSSLSEVFCDMNEVFKKLIKKNMSDEQIKDMLFEEIRGSICKGCPEYKHCHRTFSDDSKKMFEELISIALDKGKITLLDIPSYLSSRCGKTNNLISEINTLTSQYKSYSTLVGNVDTSKMLIADQLGGISDVLKGLAGEVNSLVSFDTSRESKIIDELAYNNIICSDAVVYEKDARTMCASLIVREQDASRPKLSEVVSKICGSKMCPYELYPASVSGLTTINLKTSPRYDCIFGLASKTKSGSSISGDSHSVIRLDGDRFMFALCYGMGSGEEAGRKSETAISLVENFYRAGFDNEVILSSVNKLLNLEKDEIFSTLDICIIDLRSGLADLIKMGSPSTYVRSPEDCKIIEGGALPIGILNDVRALTKKVVVGGKDFIILCSDGVSDSFGSDSEFKDFILTIKDSSPQEFADTILARALSSNNGYAVDDMTCLVVKLFEA